MNNVAEDEHNAILKWILLVIIDVRYVTPSKC